jgi:putative FmdB family regulatory protein
VPTYQYACTECGSALEAQQSFTDEPLSTCPECSGRLRKVFSAVGVVFKGSGFYRNDSRSEPVSPADGSKSDGAKSDAAKGDGTKDAGSGAGGKEPAGGSNGTKGSGGSGGSGAEGAKKPSGTSTSSTSSTGSAA